jgi:hypothetical protein
VEGQGWVEGLGVVGGRGVVDKGDFSFPSLEGEGWVKKSLERKVWFIFFLLQ